MLIVLFIIELYINKKAPRNRGLLFGISNYLSKNHTKAKPLFPLKKK